MNRLLWCALPISTLLCAPLRAQVPLTNQDDCANASMDVVGPGVYLADTNAATTGVEGQHEVNCDELGSTGVENDIWFVYTPSTTGTVVILACGFGPTSGAKVAMYPGVACPADGTSIACDGHSCPAQGGGARLVVPVTHGVDYLLQLGNAPGAPAFKGLVFIAEMLGTRYCDPAQPNSTGLPGITTVTGSGSVAQNDVQLFAAQLPPGQFGYFLVSRDQGFFQPPGSQGFVCLSNDIGRFNQPGQIIVGPTGETSIDLTDLPTNVPGSQTTMPGETLNFQCWYRDFGQNNNFTDAVSVTFH